MNKIKVAQGVLFLLLLIVFIVLGAQYLPPGIDWHLTIRPACLAMLVASLRKREIR